MKRLKNFEMYLLSREEAKQVMGGLGSATARCLDGTTISCSGAGQCSSADAVRGKSDGSCSCGSDSHSCTIV